MLDALYLQDVEGSHAAKFAGRQTPHIRMPIPNSEIFSFFLQHLKSVRVFLPFWHSILETRRPDLPADISL
jgi:hypothetical protein